MKQLYTLLFILVLTFSAGAQATLTLEEAKQYALSHSRDLILKQYEVDKAKLRVKEALATLLPSVNGYLDYTHYGALPTSIIPANAFGNPEELEVSFGYKENVNATVEFNQVVFNGVFLIGLKGADVYVDMISQEKAVSEETLLDNVVRAYYSTLLANENAGIIRQNISNLEKLLFETEQIYKNGFAEEIDIDRLKLSLSNLKTQINYLDKQEELALLMLKFTIGMPVDSALVLSDKLENFIGAASSTPAVETDFSKRREMILMDIREEINQINIKRYRAGYYPSINFFAALNSQAQRDEWSFFNFDKPWFNTRYLGVSLVVPIWDSFAKKAQVQSVKVDVQRIRTGREQLLESYKMQHRRAILDLEQSKEELENTRTNLALAQKIYNTTQIKYREGLGSSLEMNSAEREMYTAQSNYLNALYKVLVAKADLDRSLGIY